MLETQSELIRQLRGYRLKAGLTQGDIAWKLGFSLPTVSRWERGICAPDLRATGAIVDFLRRADAHTEKILLRSIQSARDSRNLWEGEDIRYLAGSRQEFAETPLMRAMVGKSIRRYMTGLYHDFIEDQAIVSSLKSGELASIDFYSGAAMSVTSIPDGFVQLKRMSFQSELKGVIRGDTHSILIPQAQAPMTEGTVVHTWDTLSRPL
ncbi:helix-turn-helix domain-containing protein [Pararhizobium sp. YC-54]|uniref:helix-turn-helix domain-containing protein n=1 Tax=Pararhizobium sp. YC-54 TaxID=2986920 RepID=UPI0021F74F0A|nr:helix-turn-helix transcriptional regulator [Pararhizobium sp. YC-54]MCW0000536.1 helix-turn-helix domain-containing protein [Pararhizobium sp. YC-54]